MLARIGGDCAGAITFRAARQSARWKDKSKVRWLSEAALSAMLKELPGRTMLTGRPGMRLTLAGAQDKLPVVLGPKFQIGLPCHGAPSTHILKTPIAMIEGSVVNEGFCMALADAMQLNPAPAKIHRVGEHEFLLVTRYDRTQTNPTRRLHQEDFCQALGIDPEAKYQQDGGPDLAQCFDLVRRVTDPSADGVSRLLDYVIFNVLIGNHDAHGKNFSLLYSNDVITLAPLYDVLSTAIYPILTTEMAMKIGGKYQFSELKLQDWNELAQNAGLDVEQVRKRIVDLSTLMPATARRLIADPDSGFAENPIVERIVELIGRRLALMRRQIG